MWSKKHATIDELMQQMENTGVSNEEKELTVAVLNFIEGQHIVGATNIEITVELVLFFLFNVSIINF